MKGEILRIETAERIAILEKENEQLRTELNTYKINTDKAIKLLKEVGCYDEENKCFCDDVWEELDELLKILDGGDINDKA